MNSTTTQQSAITQQSLRLIQIIPGTIFFREFAQFVGTEHKERFLQELGLPNPTSINWGGEVLTNEEKNAKGDMFLEFVNKKRKVTVQWQFLTQTEYRNLLGHLSINFNNTEQSVLYYKIRALNPNNAGYYEQNSKLQPNLDEMIAYLDGTFVGNVKIYNSPHNVEKGEEYTEAPMMIGYEDVSLVFLER
jgi:hypothetical protein